MEGVSLGGVEEEKVLLWLLVCQWSWEDSSCGTSATSSSSGPTEVYEQEKQEKKWSLWHQTGVWRTIFGQLCKGSYQNDAA